ADGTALPDSRARCGGFPASCAVASHQQALSPRRHSVAVDGPIARAACLGRAEPFATDRCAGTIVAEMPGRFCLEPRGGLELPGDRLALRYFREDGREIHQPGARATTRPGR